MANTTVQFNGNMASLGIFKVIDVSQELIDNLFFSSRILGGYEIVAKTYLNDIVTGEVPLVLLNKHFHVIDTTTSDINGDFSFQNLQFEEHYYFSTLPSAINGIVGPVLPTLMV